MARPDVALSSAPMTGDTGAYVGNRHFIVHV